MPYAKQTWIDYDRVNSPLSAARFNHMESGIEAAGSLIYAVAAPTGVAAVDKALIDAAITDMTARGGGRVGLLAGIYMLSGTLNIGTGIWVQGAGRGVTTLKLANGVNNHAVAPSGNNIGLTDLTVDQNQANQTAGHGIRVAEGEDHFYQRLGVKDTVGYGMGLAQSDGTSVKRMLIDDVYILNPGSDGIDTKDKLGLNVGNRMSNIVVVNPGALHQDGSSDHPGVDIRGKSWTLTNIQVLEVGNAQHGIRFRGGDGGTTGLFGGEGSSLSSFRIKGKAGTPGSIGLVMSSLYGSASNGSVEGMTNSVQCTGEGSVVSNVIGEGIAATGVGCLLGLKCKAIGCHFVNHQDSYEIDAVPCYISGGICESPSRFGINMDAAVTYGAQGLRLDPPPIFISPGTRELEFVRATSAAAFEVPTFTDTVPVDGSTNITSFADGLWRGRVFSLRCENGGTWDLVHNGTTIRLVGGATWQPTDNDVIELEVDASLNVFERSRSVNSP